MNIDKILIEINNFGFEKISKSVPTRDIKILKSLYTLVSGPKFITENQGKLLTKILRENQEHIKSIVPDLESSLLLPAWSSKFRTIDQTKKISITKTQQGEPVIAIEFAYNASIRKILLNLTKDGLQNLQTVNGRVYVADLTEKNIVLLLDTLSPLKFEVDEKLTEYYNTIKSWKIEEILSDFTVENITLPSFLKNLEKELGEISLVPEEIKIDRQRRYHYFASEQKNLENSLKSTIFSRDGTNLWVDSRQYSLTDLFTELQSLKRFPCLVIFDNYDPVLSLESLKKLEKALDAIGVTEKIGIYFRFDKGAGEEFNKIISNRSYNAPLDKDTVIAGIASNKLPKFFLKNQWKPLSVVAIGSKLRYNKAAIYANCCDLIIDYSINPTLIDTKNLWLPQN